MTENLQENTEENILVSVSDESIANVNVSVEENELEPYKKQFLKEKRKHVVLRGFRKGTAPEEMVAKFFKEEARQSARDNAIYVKYMKLLQDHKLQPLSAPKLDGMSDEDGKIHANLKVEVLQPVVLGQYLGLEIDKMPAKSIADDVEKTLGDIKQKYPKLTELSDVPADNGQVITIDFTMLDDGKEVETQKDLKVSLGINLFFKPFEEQVIGMNAGSSKEFDILFPDSYPKDNLKNKNIHFIVNVKAIHSISQYDNDELCKVLGYDDKDKMLAAITQELEEKYKNDEHLHYENQILGQLLSSHQFKLPKKLLDDEVKRILVEKQGIGQAQAEEVADRFVRTDLVLHAIYERHPDIQFKQEEFNAKVAELAVRANDTVENTMQKLQSSGKLQSYVNYLTNCKVIDFLIETADKKEPQQAPIINENNNVVINTEEVAEEKENG